MGAPPQAWGDGDLAGSCRFRHQSQGNAVRDFRDPHHRRRWLGRLPLAGAVRHPPVTRAERTVTFTNEQIAAYAEASGDHNPIHLDGAFARSVGLPGIIAHGMLQMGILGCVASEAAGGARRLRRLYWRFAGKVVPGDTVSFAACLAAGGSLAFSTINYGADPAFARTS